MALPHLSWNLIHREPIPDVQTDCAAHNTCQTHPVWGLEVFTTLIWAQSDYMVPVVG